MSTPKDNDVAASGKCPFHHGKSEEESVLARGAGSGTSNRDWWPNMLRVDLLNQHSKRSNPSARTSTTAKSSANWTIPH